MVQSYPSVSYDLCAEIEFDKTYGETDEASAESVTTSDIETAGADEGAADEAVA